MKPSTRTKWILLILAAVPVVFLLTAGATREDAADGKPVKASARVSAAVVKATRQNLAANIVLTAEFRPFQDVDVMAKVSGYVRKIYVDVGDRVKQGQVLAELEVPEMLDDRSRAHASVKRFQSDVERARDELRRSESSHEMVHRSYTRLAEVMKSRPGLIAQQEVDDARSRDLVAEAQVAAAKSALASAEDQVRVAEVDSTKTTTLLAYTRVVAPFSGVITRRYADTGSMIQAGTASQTQAMPVVRLADNSRLRLTIPVPESAAFRVQVGTPVSVRIPTLERSFTTRVSRTTDNLSLSTRTMAVEVDVDNRSGEILPGMYAEVNLDVDQRKNAVAVPVTALMGAGEHSTVLVVDKESKLARREVTVGLRTSEMAEIRQGIQEGDLVVVAGRDRLNPGQIVQARMTTEAAKHP